VASHKAMHQRKADGHHEISSDAFDKLFPRWGRCPVDGCMYRQVGKRTAEGGPCEMHGGKEC
jgi:hypothetical protein